MKIKEKAEWIINRLHKYLQPNLNCYIAGGCFGSEIKDIDLFPVTKDSKILVSAPIANRSMNATTYATKPWSVQVCNYYHSSLHDLLCSFDFAHCQVGCQVRDGKVVKDCWTDQFVTSRIHGYSWFTDSEYPFSSLIRAGKYYKQGILNRRSYIQCIFSIMPAILDRGFHDYEDFKDQMDAVDLGLLPEEYPENIKELFERLKK